MNQALHDQEGWLRVTLASIGDGVIACDVDGVVTFLNPVAEQLTGWTLAEAVGQPLQQIFRIVHEQTRAPVENPAARVLRDGVAAGLGNHTVLIAKQGTERAIDDSAAPIRSPVGTVVGCALIFRDVTERRRAEESVRRSRDTFFHLIANAPLGIFVTDSHHRLVQISRGCEKVFAGIEPLIGRYYAEVLRIVWPEPFASEAFAKWRHTLETGEPFHAPDTSELRGNQPVVEAYDWRLERITLPDGQFGVACYFFETTALRQAEWKLRASEARQSFLVKLADTLRPLGDPAEVQAAACRVLNENLGTNRVAYFEVRGPEYVVERDHAQGVVSLVGRYPTASFGVALLNRFRAGGTLVERDTTSDPARGPTELAALASIQVRAHVVVPLVKGGGFVAGLVAQSATARAWTAAEIALVEETAERTWAAVERARAEEALRQSESRFRFLDALGTVARDLSDPAAVMKAAARLLGEHLRAARCAYADVEPDNDRFTIRDDWTVAGTTSTAGTYSLHRFGPRAANDMRQGRILIVRDVDAELTAGEGADMFNAIGIKATITCPLVKEGRLLAMMAVHSATPRNWAAEEVTLVREVAERSWAHIERVRAVAALRTSEEQMRAAVSAAKLGEWTLDLRTGDMTASNGCKINYGRPLDEPFTYEQLWRVVHPDDRERVRGQVRTAIDTRGNYDTEYRILWPDGSVHWVLVRGRASGEADGRPSVMNGVSLDITERKLSEERLRASEAQRRLALDAAELGTWNIDPARNTLISDERFRMIFHGSAAPISYEEAFAAIHPEDRIRIRDAVAAATRPDDPAPYLEEYRVVHPDGAVHWVFARGRANFEPGSDGSPRLVSFDGTIMDITERVRAEQERERLVGELKALDRRKDEFLAMLSHELRNPLAPIANAVELLRLNESEDATQKQARTIIERQVMQLKRLIDDLLEVSRITMGRVQLRPERLTASGVIERAVETARPLITQRRHQLTVIVPPQAIWIQADAARIEQVVVNLLTNAAKYTIEGGRIWVIAECEGSEALIRVRDTGIGIAADLLPRVFDLFTQAERSLDRSEGGLGIGLALVKSLVELHGGRVEAGSEPGKGSEFTVRLPLAAAPASVAPSTMQTTSAEKSCRVLVVDDHVDSAESMARLLRIKNHEVRTAHDGLSALATAIEYQPQVVLLDIGLPHIDGYEVARRMRQQPSLQQAVLVAMTGYGQDTDRQRSRDAGFNHHLVKPARYDTIQQILSAVSVHDS